jgi:hypothetical protein
VVDFDIGCIVGLDIVVGDDETPTEVFRVGFKLGV